MPGLLKMSFSKSRQPITWHLLYNIPAVIKVLVYNLSSLNGIRLQTANEPDKSPSLITGMHNKVARTLVQYFHAL